MVYRHIVLEPGARVTGASGRPLLTRYVSRTSEILSFLCLGRSNAWSWWSDGRTGPADQDVGDAVWGDSANPLAIALRALLAVRGITCLVESRDEGDAYNRDRQP